MSTVLILRNGAEAGRKIAVRANQVVTVGQTEWADFSVPSDQRMAPLHFQLAADHQQCELRDLSKGGGTLVNGQPITAQVLSHGDIILAGTTQFEVWVERAAAAKSAEGSPDDVRYERVLVGPDIEVLRGPAADRVPLKVIQLVAQRYPAHLLIDFHRAGIELPPNGNAGPDLLARLPEPLRAGRTLHRVPLNDFARNLIGQAWGKDAMTCLFSQAEGEQLEQAIWSSLGAFLRPAFLRQQLQQAGRLPSLLAAFAAVLVEVNGNSAWELYRNPTAAPRWNDLGLPLPQSK